MSIKLDLGCGNDKVKGWIGLDREASRTPTIVVDLMTGIPYKDNEVDYIHTSHFLEHVLKPEFIISEIYRVCKNNSIVDIVIPLNLPIDIPRGHVITLGDDFIQKYIDPVKFKLLFYEIKIKDRPFIFEEATIKLRITKKNLK